MKSESNDFREWRRKAIERHESRPLIKALKALDDAHRKADSK
jgi:hypothetical protein